MFQVELTAVVSQLLQQNPEKRLDSIEALKQEKLLATMDWEAVELRKVQPKYIPPVSEPHSNSDDDRARHCDHYGHKCDQQSSPCN